MIINTKEASLLEEVYVVETIAWAIIQTKELASRLWASSSLTLGSLWKNVIDE